MATTTIKRSAGRPTREQAQHIDDIILSGAREAFCRRGIEGTSMEELALSVGVSKHTIYRRYTGKMALLDAVVTRDLDRLRQAMDEDGTGHSPLDRLRFAARRFFLFCVEPDSVRFMAFMTSESVFSEELRERFATWDRCCAIRSSPVFAKRRRPGNCGATNRRRACSTCWPICSTVPAGGCSSTCPTPLAAWMPTVSSSIAGPSS